MPSSAEGVALKESARAVKELKKEQIEEVRSFHNPPTQVRQAGQVPFLFLFRPIQPSDFYLGDLLWHSEKRCYLDGFKPRTTFFFQVQQFQTVFLNQQVPNLQMPNVRNLACVYSLLFFKVFPTVYKMSFSPF